MGAAPYLLGISLRNSDSGTTEPPKSFQRSDTVAGVVPSCRKDGRGLWMRPPNGFHPLLSPQIRKNPSRGLLEGTSHLPSLFKDPTSA